MRCFRGLSARYPRVRELFRAAVLVLAIILFGLFSNLPEKIPQFLERMVTPDWAVWLALKSNSAPQAQRPVSLIEFDDETFRHWGHPPRFPRDELYGLVRFAARGGAEAIIVDVDLTASADEKEFDELLSFLNAYENEQARNGSNIVPLLLVRRLWPLVDAGGNVSVPTYNMRGRDALAGKLADLESFMQSAEFVLWVNALLERDERGVVRTWSIARLTCNPPYPQFPTAFLSPGTVVGELVHTPEPLLALKRAKGVAKHVAELRCGPQASKGSTVPSFLKTGFLAGPNWNLPIPFVFRFTPGTREFSAAMATDRYGRLRNLVTAFSARNLVSPYMMENKSFARLDCAAIHAEEAVLRGAAPGCDLIADRIVVIGATHIDTGDHHVTPLGTMPGMHILANIASGGSAVIMDAQDDARLLEWAPIAFALSWLLLSSFLRPLLFGLFAVSLVLAIVVLGSLAGFSPASLSSTIFKGTVLYGFALLLRRFYVMVSRRLSQFTGWVRRLAARIAGPSTTGILVCAAAIVAAHPDSAHAQTPVGVVSHFEPVPQSSSAVLIRRANQSERSLRIAEELLEGDVIRVPNRDVTVHIMRSGGSHVICEVTARNSECSWQAQGSGFWRQLPQYWTEIVDMLNPSPVAANSVTRGPGQEQNDPLRIPVSKGVRQNLLRSSGGVPVIWFGGKPPFRMTLRSGEAEVDKGETSQRFIALPYEELCSADSTYFKVRDNAGGEADINFTCVDALPPNEIAALYEHMLQADRTFILATFLSRLDNGAWTLEAVQQVRRIPEPSLAARMFVEKLFSGNYP